MSKITNKDLLKSFEKYKTYDDEKFKFLKFPNVKPYKYIISNYGKLFDFVSEKPKKFCIDKDGYYKSTLLIYKDNKKISRSYFVHRMVAYTFCKMKDGCNVVNHLDGNKTNNYYKNLEWTPPLENTRHALKTGLQFNSGVNCPSSIYPENMIRMICKMLEDSYDDYTIYRELTGDEKIKNMAVYALIHSIKKKKRHREISSEYNIPDYVESIKHPKFSKDDVMKINQMILEGKRTMDIIRFFGESDIRSQNGRRICDKVRYERKKNK